MTTTDEWWRFWFQYEEQTTPNLWCRGVVGSRPRSQNEKEQPLPEARLGSRVTQASGRIRQWVDVTVKRSPGQDLDELEAEASTAADAEMRKHSVGAKFVEAVVS
jgi:hypothetical protein